MSYEAQHAYRERHKHDRCHVCGNSYSGPYSKCDSCRAKQKAAYDLKRKLGICIKCGDPVLGEEVLCLACKITKQIFTGQGSAFRTKKPGRSIYGDFPDKPARDRFYANRQTAIRRQKVLDAYGRECKCCKETIEVFLTIDHKDGNGAKYRLQLGNGNRSTGSSKFYTWLIKNNFPDGYQTMCWNCNRAKYQLGTCPHQSLVASESLVGV